MTTFSFSNLLLFCLLTEFIFVFDYLIIIQIKMKIEKICEHLNDIVNIKFIKQNLGCDRHKEFEYVSEYLF